MTHPTLADVLARSPTKMAEDKSDRRFVPRKDFRPGGERGKLHRELGVPEGEKIPKNRLNEAARSRNPEIRRDAIRAKTMEGWHHGGSRRRNAFHTHPSSKRG